MCNTRKLLLEKINTGAEQKALVPNPPKREDALKND